MQFLPALAGIPWVLFVIAAVLHPLVALAHRRVQEHLAPHNHRFQDLRARILNGFALSLFSADFIKASVSERSAISQQVERSRRLYRGEHALIGLQARWTAPATLFELGVTWGLAGVCLSLVVDGSITLGRFSFLASHCCVFFLFPFWTQYRTRCHHSVVAFVELFSVVCRVAFDLFRFFFSFSTNCSIFTPEILILSALTPSTDSQAPSSRSRGPFPASRPKRASCSGCWPITNRFGRPARTC